MISIDYDLLLALFVLVIGSVLILTAKVVLFTLVWNWTMSNWLTGETIAKTIHWQTALGVILLSELLQHHY